MVMPSGALRNRNEEEVAVFSFFLTRRNPHRVSTAFNAADPNSFPGKTSETTRLPYDHKFVPP